MLDDESTPPSDAPRSSPAETNSASESKDESEIGPQAELRASDSGRPKTEFERKLGMLSTMVQIVAIIGGGIFAIIKFGFLESPALQTNFRLSGSLDWVERADSSCLAILDIDVTNLSKSKIQIEQVQGRAWLIEEPPRIQKAIQYFEISKEIEVEGRVPVEAFEYIKGPLVQEYAPGQSAHHTFEWYVERKKSSYAVFKIEVFDEPGAKKPLDYQIQWDLPCNVKSEKTPNAAEKQK